MRKYRVIKYGPFEYTVQKKFLWWWVSVYTTNDMWDAFTYEERESQ